MTVSAGSSRNSSHVQEAGWSTAPSIVKLHSGSGVWGVGPADRTGKSRVTYWPGGTREGSTVVAPTPAEAAADRRHGFSATAASGVATWKLKLSSRYSRTTLAVVRVVADREVLPGLEDEVSAAQADDDRALDARRPDDRAVEDLAQVLEQRVAAAARPSRPPAGTGRGRARARTGRRSRSRAAARRRRRRGSDTCRAPRQARPARAARPRRCRRSRHPSRGTRRRSRPRRSDARPCRAIREVCVIGAAVGIAQLGAGELEVRARPRPAPARDAASPDTPSHGAPGSGVMRPRLVAEYCHPCGPEKSTSLRAASAGATRSRASSSSSFQPASLIGACPRRR